MWLSSCGSWCRHCSSAMKNPALGGACLLRVVLPGDEYAQLDRPTLPSKFLYGFQCSRSWLFRSYNTNNSSNSAITTTYIARSRRAAPILQHVLITAFTSLAITAAHAAGPRGAASEFGHVLIVVTSLAITTTHTACPRWTTF